MIFETWCCLKKQDSWETAQTTGLVFHEPFLFFKKLWEEWNVGIAELLILAVGLSMDAFAVSVCKGLALKRVNPRHMALVGLWFGGFQALMPLIG